MFKTCLLLVVFAITINAQMMPYPPPFQIPQSNLPPPKTVDQVNVYRYLGKWYEQAVIPYFFQNNCTHTTATYSLNEDCKTIKVDNKCRVNGQLNTTIGKAVAVDETNSKLIVTFPQTFNIEGKYWIVRLDQFYSYAVVSSPDYVNLWILYRKPMMPEQLYNEIIEDLKKDGFPVEKLVKTEQCPE